MKAPPPSYAGRNVFTTRTKFRPADAENYHGDSAIRNNEKVLTVNVQALPEVKASSSCTLGQRWRLGALHNKQDTIS